MKLQKTNQFQEGRWYEFSITLHDRLISVMARKENKKITAFKNICPHQGRRLDYIQGQFLTDDKGTIICPAHGAEFSPMTGACFSGPCKGQGLTKLETIIKGEDVYVIYDE